VRKITELPDKLWLALAFVLRAGLALKLGNGLYQADENGSDALAWLWSQTGSFEAHDKFIIMPPIPTGFLALCYSLCGHHPVMARLAGAGVGTALVWLVGRFVKELTGSQKSGKLALLLAAVYPFFIYYSAMLMSETIYLVFATAGFWFLCSSLMDRGTVPWKAAAAGLSFALMGLSRGEAAVICGVILACTALSALSGRWSARAWALACLLWIVPLLGWAYRNKVVGGHWALDKHAGMAMVHGTILFELNEVDTGKAMEALHDMKIWKDTQSLSDDERDKAFMDESIRFIREHPGRIAVQWVQKFVNFWRFYPRQDKAYAGIHGNDPAAGFGRGFMILVSLLFEPAIIMGGLWGLWTLRARWEELYPLALFILGTMGVHILSVSQMRYRLPIIPMLILGLCSLLDRDRPPRSGLSGA
jgi:hypothetical protein